MASSLNASTSGGGGVITTADASGNLDIQSGGSTVVAVTSTGAKVSTGSLTGSYGTGGITTNFAAGDAALNANTTGSQNVAVGVSALISNTTGAANLAVGYQALGSNVSGSNNLAMGQTALYYNTASNNTAVGYQAMQGASGTSTGASNSAFGSSALTANTTGVSNAAMGKDALGSNTTGGSNSALGASALYSNTTNSNNTAVGTSALFYNTASNNTAVGYQAMYGAIGTSTGVSNSALGYQALFANTTGTQNIAVGLAALSVNTTGIANTVIGYDSGRLLTTGSSNQVFGDQITLAAAATGRIAIGTNFTHGVNTSVIIGNATNRISNSYTVNATWAFSSDERIKNVIGKDTLGLDFINDLEPVTFRWKPSNEVPKELTSRYAEENVQDTDIVMHGLIAQNVKAALDKAGVDTFTGWSEDEDGTQKLGITDLITPMINAIKELKAIVEIQAEQIKVLKGE